MKYHIRRSVGAIIFVIALATAMYTQRVRIADLAREASAPELPEAVSYADAAQQTEKPATESDERTIPDAPEIPEPVADVPAKTANEEPPVVLPTVSDIPASYNLAVPFTSQAPFANWDALHEETCEEAAAYMVAAYYLGVQGVIDSQVAENELQRLVAIENDLFGYYQDTTAVETAQLVAKAYGLHAQTENDLTVEDIKNHVAAGHPVIVPTAGRLLHNPNFSGDGPPYHMIVIRGYTETQFIANDPGTRRGEGYVYDINTVMDATHDWTGSFDTIETGPKVVVVIYPE
ncbi:hypothetical protein A2304_00390 [Candidatus Uhrbacteria bacterium RIFOXYB2_FULL_57_15]|uniref:Peptidase C39-like domain-containing protein n=1 Tax=Candidatus Uhrbacteria bacterium RIFOXYB2_FULL_57_15 TaxID=1802422 RepID=A0A1F7W5Q1_9BACT|nr:MAG: hypothetical protein A2304_00390 [Candidatus Uhrbacteria bacterium RIFOXYB2_FULL_57_15]